MIHLGFELGTGEPIAIPLRHLAVVGQTQESGKTTTLEALIHRADDLDALAFVTKRGEGAFAGGATLPPYFRDRADWQFVDSLLEAQLREKNKFLRPWIMKICRNTRSLADVHREVKTALAKAKGIHEGVYTQLDAYLDLIVPEIGRARLAPAITLQRGLNVMDLAGYSTPMQMLFVQSAIDWILTHCRHTITIIPEAWEFIPEGKGSPVKNSAVALVRKGAGLHNFIWVDSQDTAGVDKTILRGCTVWLLGVQREANEIKRNLANIPAGIKKPKPADIAHLQRGQFFACWSDRTIKVYVQPAWMNETAAQRIARGEAQLSNHPDRAAGSAAARSPLPAGEPTPLVPLAPSVPSNDPDPQQEEPVDPRILQTLQRIDTKLDRALNSPASPADPAAGPTTNAPAPLPADEEALYQRFKQRLLQEAPALVKILTQQPELNIEVERHVITADGSSCYGLIAQLIAEHQFDECLTATAVHKELQRRGYKGISARIYEQLPILAKQGFLTNEGKAGYKAVKGMKVNITTKK